MNEKRGWLKRSLEEAVRNEAQHPAWMRKLNKALAEQEARASRFTAAAAQLESEISAITEFNPRPASPLRSEEERT